MADPKARLNEINDAARKKQIAAHAEFNAAFDAAMKRHGVKIAKLSDVIEEFPVEFHDDEELCVARTKFLETMKSVREDKDTAARDLARPKLKFVRTMRMG